MYWRYTILTSVTSIGAGGAIFSLLHGAVVLGNMSMACLWAPVAGVVACVATAYPAYCNKEKANWCKQGLFPIARVRCQTGSKLTVSMCNS